MCGICFSLHTQPTSISIDYTPLNARGPDFQQELAPIALAPNLYITFAVSVLALRGYKQQQPFIDLDDESILLYNGEIYDGPLQIKPDDNDGRLLFEHLQQCSTDEDICEFVSKLQGCFAFIYFRKPSNILYYARDLLGRRSLMCTIGNDSQSNLQMIVSSVRLHRLSYTELDAGIIHKLIVIKDTSTFKLEQIPFVKQSIIPLLFDLPAELECDPSFQIISTTFLSQLQAAVERRITNLPSLCRECKRLTNDNLRPSNGCIHAKLAILFSGGIDSSVLAALVDRVLPSHEPIDLLNVAFFSDASTAPPPPDRQTGLQALTELNAARRWNFVKIDVRLDELQTYREHIIKDALYPCTTVLDDSIGSALWFAARGIGLLHGENVVYDSSAEILLSGLGADEQLGGYSRHRSTFQSSGWKALEMELEMEMNRISKRNLGRDDRVISSLGKEVRFPFLDEQLVVYLRSIPIWFKADLRLSRGIGEKFLLRFVARHQLNLHQSSTYPKRAIQFGSRIAKLENRKEKASDQCSRLTTNDDDE